MSEIAKVVFEDDLKKLTFEDLQPKVIFANEFKKLVFDVVNLAGSYNLDYNLDYE